MLTQRLLSRVICVDPGNREVVAGLGLLEERLLNRVVNVEATNRLFHRVVGVETVDNGCWGRRA